MIILATLLSIQSGIPWTWLPGTTNAGGLVIEVVLEPTELTVEGGRECVCVWHIKLTTMISSELSFAYIRSSKSTSKMRSEVRQDMSLVILWSVDYVHSLQWLPRAGSFPIRSAVYVSSSY